MFFYRQFPGTTTFSHQPLLENCNPLKWKHRQLFSNGKPLSDVLCFENPLTFTNHFRNVPFVLDMQINLVLVVKMSTTVPWSIRKKIGNVIRMYVPRTLCLQRTVLRSWFCGKACRKELFYWMRLPFFMSQSRMGSKWTVFVWCVASIWSRRQPKDVRFVRGQFVDLIVNRIPCTRKMNARFLRPVNSNTNRKCWMTCRTSFHKQGRWLSKQLARLSGTTWKLFWPAPLATMMTGSYQMLEYTKSLSKKFCLILPKRSEKCRLKIHWHSERFLCVVHSTSMLKTLWMRMNWHGESITIISIRFRFVFIFFNFSTGKWRAGFYVYKKASLAKHSCAPNCVWNISNFPDFRIRLRAAYPLTKGQVLTVNHLENHAEGQKGTVERRIGYFFRFGHICMCELCVDPTEFGTYISAIVCKKCRGPDKDKIESENLGYLLPDNNHSAIGIKGNVPWRCNACKSVIQLSKVYPKIEEITNALEANDGKSIDYIATNAENLARSLIAKYRDTVLHPNHWLIQKATLILIDNGYHDMCRRLKNTDQDVENLLTHCQFMLKILNKLHPGFSALKSKYFRIHTENLINPFFSLPE